MKSIAIFIVLYFLPLLPLLLTSLMKREDIIVLYFVLFPVALAIGAELSKRRKRFGNRDFPDWLRVMWQPITETKLKAWHPDWTCIESNFEPVVRFVEPEGWWRIEFIVQEQHRQRQTRKESAWRSSWK